MAKLSMNQLINFSEQLATMLEAGLPLSRALEVSGRQARGRAAVAVRTLRGLIEKGATFTDALEQSGVFPDFYVRLAEVGESGGALDRVIADLADFYSFKRSLRRDFISRIVFPVLQYVFAVAVVTAALFILRHLGSDAGNPAWVAGVGYGLPAALVLVYYGLLKPLAGARPLHEVALRVPMIREIVLSLALARFSRVMHLTFEAGMPIAEGVERAMQVTENGAFAARAGRARRAIDAGRPLTGALQEARVFPAEFTDVVQVAEEAGKLSERFAWLTEHYTDRARFAMRAFVSVLSRLVWVLVAVVMVIFIFRMFTTYRGAIEGSLGR